ncbi:MAG: hypothetical protein AABW85_02765 [archaeon]
MDEDKELEMLMKPSEELRLKLLKQEFRLRKKQPEAWTKTKFRKYANFRTKRKEPLTEEIQVAKIMEKKVA